MREYRKCPRSHFYPKLTAIAFPNQAIIWTLKQNAIASSIN
ncbi:hypothetical protein [Brunnivagina elsteri]|nr:hypothetical protein [Calothrix elsteri]